MVRRRAESAAAGGSGTERTADTREDDGHDGLHHHLGLHLRGTQHGGGGAATEGGAASCALRFCVSAAWARNGKRGGRALWRGSLEMVARPTADFHVPYLRRRPIGYTSPFAVQAVCDRAGGGGARSPHVPEDQREGGADEAEEGRMRGAVGRIHRRPAAAEAIGATL